MATGTASFHVFVHEIAAAISPSKLEQDMVIESPCGQHSPPEWTCSISHDLSHLASKRLALFDIMTVNVSPCVQHSLVESSCFDFSDTSHYNTERMLSILSAKSRYDLVSELQDLVSILSAISRYVIVDELQGLQEKLLTSPEFKLKLISGVYGSDPRNKGKQVFKIEHCALQERGNQWNLEIKYRMKGSKTSLTPWFDVWDFYPDAMVKMKHNYIELTIDSPKDYHEFAVFGIPEKKDKKRMQLGIFGEKPTKGNDWTIFVTLFDDTLMAFKHLCDKEESKGRRLLTTPAALFVSNNDEDINIDISSLDGGGQIKGSNVKTIKAKDAWNSPENSIDFPGCVFEISHVDKTKQLFSCDVTACHSNDIAKTEVVAFFEQKNEMYYTGKTDLHKKEIHEEKITEVFAFLQMLIFLVGCLSGADLNPFSQ